MPSLREFSDNLLQSKQDLVVATRSLLRPLTRYFSKENARIRLPVASGAHFDEVAADLEGYARPLWAVAALLEGTKAGDGDAASETQSLVAPWIEGLRHGVDPSHEEYWGPVGDWDQRMVEAEIISFALLTAPEAFYEPLAHQDKVNLEVWLKGLNEKIMPENNWRWFRVLSNLALIKVCGVEKEALWPYIEKDLETLESFYMADGWSSDGFWRPEGTDTAEEGTGINAARGRHADYYSGSFALQFSQILYSKFASDLDPERCVLFKQRAKEFAKTFWTYFDERGASIPFGRSLSYRFAMGGYYAAFAYAGLCDDNDPILSHGTVKGMLLRHLRWWASSSENTFWPDGTLNIGYLYPNMYMSEDYNSPQSPYWALKSLIVVALSESDKFWSAKELPHPLARTEEAQITVVKPARQILCNHSLGKHHFLLSSGQFCVWPMKAAQAKYAKFAYSSAFGFSVPTGPLITQICPDSMLALSRDNGESWAVRWISTGETQFLPVPLTATDGSKSSVMSLVNRWKPWASGRVEIETTLTPPTANWPDWHVRVHRIRSNGDPYLASFTAVEGGFAIDGRRASDKRVFKSIQADSQANIDASLQDGEGAISTPDSSLVLSSAGASGIVNLTLGLSQDVEAVGEVMKPDPNTNLMTPRTLLPTVKHSSSSWPNQDITIVTAVFAMSSSNGKLELSDIEQRWSRRPCVRYDINAGITLS